ncbi:MAG TPA: hypothetical protein DDZ89_21165, partial [Clostridiales bacterium]|nr:hypothetical protein [Clostridiales bacterium]
MNDQKFYLVGAGKTDITPVKPVPYLGFSPRHALFEGVNDKLYARAMVISDGNCEVAIISADTIGMANHVLGKDRHFTDEVREKIEKATGIQKDQIMLTSPHIHSAPETISLRPLRDENGIEWVEELQLKIVEAVAIAKADMFEARMKVATGNVEGISYNRRKESLLDTGVTAVLFESINNDRVALITHFSLHPVIMQVQELVSADYPGVLHQQLECTIKDYEGGLFLQGACGDIDPVIGNTRKFRDVHITGSALAGEVLKLYSKMSFPSYEVQPVQIKTATGKMNLPSRSLPDAIQCEELVKKIEEVHAQNKAWPASDRIKEEHYYRIKEGSNPYEGELQMFLIGNVLLTGIPGEPFGELGRIIKQESKPFWGLPVGYANGYLGYIAPKAAWEKGGYEV